VDSEQNHSTKRLMGAAASGGAPTWRRSSRPSAMTRMLVHRHRTRIERVAEADRAGPICATQADSACEVPVMVSNASPLALIASSRRSRSKKPRLPHCSAPHQMPSIRSLNSDLLSNGQKLFRGALPDHDRLAQHTRAYGIGHHVVHDSLPAKAQRVIRRGHLCGRRGRCSEWRSRAGRHP
jgi:hypothetical protein